MSAYLGILVITLYLVCYLSLCLRRSYRSNKSKVAATHARPPLVHLMDAWIEIEQIEMMAGLTLEDLKPLMSMPEASQLAKRKFDQAQAARLASGDFEVHKEYAMGGIVHSYLVPVEKYDHPESVTLLGHQMAEQQERAAQGIPPRSCKGRAIPDIASYTREW